MKKVLVVDDTKNIRNLLTTCLEIEGYRVVAVGDGARAMELLTGEPFDLAFLDIKLPQLSGTEVLRKLRNQGLTLPVIIMTAFATVKNAVECTRLGAVAYLQKPFTADKVRNVLAEINTGFEREKTDLAALLQEAERLIETHRLDGADESLKKALALNPDCGKTYVLLARLYELQGKTMAAKRFHNMAGQFGGDTRLEEGD